MLDVLGTDRDSGGSGPRWNWREPPPLATAGSPVCATVAGTRSASARHRSFRGIHRSGPRGVAGQDRSDTYGPAHDTRLLPLAGPVPYDGLTLDGRAPVPPLPIDRVLPRTRDSRVR